MGRIESVTPEVTGKESRILELTRSRTTINEELSLLRRTLTRLEKEHASEFTLRTQREGIAEAEQKIRLLDKRIREIQVEPVALPKVPVTPEVITPQTPLPTGQYVRVTIKEPGKRQTSFWAKVDTRGKKANIYIPVDKEGIDLSREVRGEYILPKDLIQHSLIVKEELAEINLTYGTLEVIKPKVAIPKAEAGMPFYWYSVSELKQMCQQRGLSTEGSKEDLIRRLRRL